MADANRNLRATALRLATTEYLPLAGWLAMWAIVAAAIRPADVVRLLAAVLFGRALREFTAMDTAAGMRRRWGASRDVRRRSLRVAARAEMATLAVELILLAALVGALYLIGEPVAAQFLVVQGVGAPARHFAPANGGRRRAGLHRSVLGWSGVLLVTLALALESGAMGVAAALAAREWVALGVSSLPTLRPRRPFAVHPRDEPLSWREVAAITATGARTRLGFRITKGLLSVFGPIGSVLARTGRGVGAHRRLARWTPRTPATAGAVGLGTFIATAAILVALPEPATLVLAAGLLRVAGAAGSAAIWAPYATGEDADEDEIE